MKKLVRFLTTILTLGVLTTSFGQTKLSVDTFTTFPPEIDGCSCYFSNDSIEFKDRKYIYANDYDRTSFLKVGGIMTKFRMTDFREVDKKNTVEKYTSDKYEMTIELKDGGKKGDETWLRTGTIKLTDKKGMTLTKTFYGECGC